MRLPLITPHGNTKRRNGKVARLPHATRQLINRMLDDGVMYKDIITRLGEVGHGLTIHNISNWRVGGYQDHLTDQMEKAIAQNRTKTVAELAASNRLPGAAAVADTINRLALIQQLELVAENGTELAAEALRRNPAKFITLINTCVNIANAETEVERLKLDSSKPPQRDRK